jgi:adenosylcobinamide-GDP ribazoletransferase
MGDIRRALGLLTVLPVRPAWDEQAVPGRAMAWYPLAGLAIGVLLALLALMLGKVPRLGPGSLLPAALVVAAWAGLTGALHLDGWADCCDALFVPVTRERRLEIMRDPRLGSFGGAGLVLLLLIKGAAIQGLLARASAGSWVGLWPLLVAPVLARWAVVVSARAFPSARAEGMAAYFRRGLSNRAVAVATASAVIISAVAGLPVLILWGVAALTMVGLAALAQARLGGLTGDVYGATIELAESSVLVVAWFWRM